MQPSFAPSYLSYTSLLSMSLLRCRRHCYPIPIPRFPHFFFLPATIAPITIFSFHLPPIPPYLHSLFPPCPSALTTSPPLLHPSIYFPFLICSLLSFPLYPSLYSFLTPAFHLFFHPPVTMFPSFYLPIFIHPLISS